MFTKKHQVLMKLLETEKLWQKQPSDILIKLKDMKGANYYIFQYCPTEGLVYALIDRLDFSPIDEILIYLEDLSGPFFYFNQFPYARMDYHDKQQELTIAHKNKHTVIF